jgi:hypothetical protein
MSITNKINMWNGVLLKADTKVKQVVDHTTGEFYFEVAKYRNDNSLACRAINKIREKSGVDLRFSFINIGKVVFTTKHEANVEDFIKDYRFDINTENFAYSKVTIKELDAIKRSNALDKVMDKELPININALSHIHIPLPKGDYSNNHTELSKRVPSMTIDTPKSEYKVELDDFAKELISEFSKPEHKNAVKIVKSKSLGRGR